jgi:hypothetical protein
VRALLVREHKGDVVLEAAAQARHVQDDGRGGRLERASVKVARLEQRPFGPIQRHSAAVHRNQWPFGPIAIIVIRGHLGPSQSTQSVAIWAHRNQRV